MRKRRPAKQDESILRDELFLQPWFLPKPTYLALRRLLPSSQLLKMRYYFDAYGCLKCGDRASLYGSNGFAKVAALSYGLEWLCALRGRFKKIGAKVDRVALRRFISRLHQADLGSPGKGTRAVSGGGTQQVPGGLAIRLGLGERQRSRDKRRR